MRRVVAVCVLLGLGSIGWPVHTQPLQEWFDLSVPGGAATLEELRIDLDERAFTIPLIARALYDRESRIGLTHARVLAVLATAAKSPSEAVEIPLPLEVRIWRQLLPPPDTTNLFTRIVTDRNALLLATGLTATHDSIRALLTRDRDLLRHIYQHTPAAFVIVSRRLRVADGRVTVPGGAQTDAIWRSLVGEAPTRPGPFVRALLSKDAGRMAWYYDTIAGLDKERLAAAWPEERAQEEAASLYAAFRESDPQWRAEDQPFRRSLADAWSVVTQMDVETSQVRSVLPQSVWALLFSTPRPGPDQLARAARDGMSRVSLSWLTREIVSAPARERRQRFEMFRLAQRVFAHAGPTELADVATVVSGIRDCRALLFALERMNISTTATWKAALAAARHVSERSDDRRDSLTAFQATVALIERIRHVRTIDAQAADRLVRSLSDAVVVDDRVTRSLNRWIVDALVRALPPLIRPDALTAKTAYESRIVQAMAGPTDRRPPRLEWEGLTYAVDIVSAEHARLRATRSLLPTPGLDEALAGGRPRELADALTAMVYANALGDPDGPVSLSPDVVTRHDLGLTGTSIVREESPWAPPEERQGFGPWHVQGSLIGLDLGMSRLVLRRVADEEMPSAPTLTLNDLGTLTRTAVAMVAAELTDEERDELAAAIQRGRARVDQAGVNLGALDGLMVEARVSETGRQLAAWIAARDPKSLPRLFSLRDLLWLGKPQLTPAQLDRWGVAADGLDGRRVTAMPRPAPWEDYAGRSEAGQVTTQVPDVTLRLIEETKRLKLPAVLIPAMLAFALQDYWHEVHARFADDWPQLTRQAAALPAARIQDYVAALAGNGPLRAQ
jgi:hypothetical protein